MSKNVTNMRIYAFFLFSFALFLSACSSSDDVSSTKLSTSSTETVDTATLTDSYTYELPVIFHVLYQNKDNPNQYIPYQRIKNLVQYVNEIYQGGIYGESENVHVKFVLAATDENGRKIKYPGVDYVQYTGGYPIDIEKFMSDDTGSNVKYIWEPNNYINVMMFNFNSTDNNSVTLGISHMPYSIKGDPTYALPIVRLSTVCTPTHLQMAAIIRVTDTPIQIILRSSPGRRNTTQRELQP